MSDKYYETTMFVCRECGKKWNTPGGAEACYNKDTIVDLMKEVENHPQLYLPELIDVLEDMIQAGEFDYDES